MRWIALLTIGSWLNLVVGCGGGLSQEDMRRNAIRRPSDDNDDKTTSPNKKTQPGDKAKVAAVTAPQGPPAAAQTPAAPTTTAEAAPTPENPATPDPTTTNTVTQTPSLPASAGREDSAALTPIARRQRSIDNLTQIGDAIRRHSEAKGRLFSRAICNAKGQPLLSWRVELLPYLGQQALYDQFDVTQPWDSARNLPFAKLIPDVYQSPERFDEKTNYLVPVASFTPFSSLRGMSLRKFEDGPENTIVLLEVDAAAAVAWTKPADLNINLTAKELPFGNLRENGFFAVWGDGSVTRVAAERSQADLKAVLSYDGGDVFTSHVVRASTSAAPPAAQVDTKSDIAAPHTTVVDAAAALAEGTEQLSPINRRHATGQATQRLPVPDAQSLERARDLVRDIYQHDYENAKTIHERKALAQLMLQQISDMAEDPAGQYVVLDIATQVSNQIGDSVTAVAAMEQMLARFEVDELAFKHRFLQQLATGKNRNRAVQQTLREEATALIGIALDAEEFGTAESLCQIALRAARQLADSHEVAKIEEQRQFVEETRKAHRAMHRAIATLEDAEDPKANLEVGRYYSLIRGDWEKGLPLLAKGNDARLKRLALVELSAPREPTEQVELADGWWELSNKDRPHQELLRLHATHWYLRAKSGLPQGLLRVKAELRVAQVEREYGSTAVATVASDRR